MNHYIGVLKKYAVFAGRAGRAEYWMFVLISLVASTILSYIGPTLSMIYSLAVFIPSLAVSVRRLHDTGRSGWWLLINLVPFVGWLVYLVFMVLGSEAGENAYGPNPSGTPAPAATPPPAPAAPMQ